VAERVATGFQRARLNASYHRTEIPPWDERLRPAWLKKANKAVAVELITRPPAESPSKLPALSAELRGRENAACQGEI
jgi:hypothetical protein